MTVLTGETGAGKSILLDAFGPGARGARRQLAGAGRRRQGRRHRRLRAAPDHIRPSPPRRAGDRDRLRTGHPPHPDGRRPEPGAINDQPVSLNLLRQIAGQLTEIHGQHADRALVDTQTHRQLLDAYGGLEEEAQAVARALAEGERRRRHALPSIRRSIAKAEAERDYLTHAAEELRALAPRQRRGGGACRNPADHDECRAVFLRA